MVPFPCDPRRQCDYFACPSITWLKNLPGKLGLDQGFQFSCSLKGATQLIIRASSMTDAVRGRALFETVIFSVFEVGCRLFVISPLPPSHD